MIKQAYYKEKAIKLRQLTSMLNLPKHKLTDLMAEQPPKRFVYLAKKIDPAISQQIKELKLAGIECLTEFKRFYPVADVSAHLVGFTDIEGVGQVGLELGYEKELKGTPGGKRVLKDGHGQVIAEVASTKPPESGKSIELTIDQRIQYLAYKELEAAVTANKAQAGTLVILDAKSGDIIAAVNQPSFNPNTRENLKEAVYRNRAFTEVFEPGSTVKPFIVAASLDHGLVRPNDVFYTQGVFHIGSHTVKDVHNYGTMDLTQVLKKSSNIAVSQMALKMSSLYLWEFYRKLGFSLPIKTGFPGEARGSLINYKRMREFDRATLSFGYGVNVSALQLAQAYTALADDGMLHRANLIKNDDTQGIDTERRVFTAATAKRVRAMMEHVVSKDGTAYEARVHGYTVAGKTGTVKKANGKHGYAEKKYFSVFLRAWHRQKSSFSDGRYD
ncbi:peptidoglycan D,D-transpeptidase FtsI family protein [Methylocucumis oryzae]|uniref:peptidoglycan D,D-transpeptidase FtsI family protein n=1 Tax=Methylocucumis oryzae TaxID=1632867 RepID=UPI000698B6E7